MDDFGLGKVVTKVGGEVVEKVAPEWAKPLTRAVFGTNAVPKGAAEVLNKTSKIQADTFTKGINFDSGLREPLEKIYTLAGEGRSDAYELLTIVGRDFKEQALNAKKLKQAQTQYFKSQQALRDAADPTVTGDKGRKGKQRAAEGSDKSTLVTSHQQGMLYQPEPDQVLKGHQGGDRFITEGHHVNILDEYNKIITQHSSWKDVTPESPSPVVEVMEKVMGIKAGNNVANIADVLSNMTRNSRIARTQGLVEQSEGILHPTTINDYLGVTKYNPKEFTQEQAVGLNLFKKNNPDATVDDFVVAWKKQTGETISEGEFPNIRVYAPDAVSSGKKKAPPLETIEIKTQADHDRRISLVFDALDRHGINTKTARQNFDRSKILVDSKLDIYGYDHEITHQILREMKKMEGTAQFEIEQLGPEGIFNLSFDAAVKLQLRSSQEMETVLANVLQYRYTQVKELFGRLNPELGADGYEKLLAGEKQVFFKKNVNTLAVMGNVEKAMTIDAAMKPIKNWNNHIGDTFGWSPQSLWITIKELEEVIKEVAEKVPTTQPIPGQVSIPSKAPGSFGHLQTDKANIQQLQELDNQLGDMMEGVKPQKSKRTRTKRKK